MALVLLVVCARSSFAANQITAWPDNRNGAVSISFDDGCQSQVSLGVPALNARGIKGTFFIVTSDINDNDGYSPPWASWRSVANLGHEIASHTITHPDLTTLSSTQIQTELAGSKTVIDTQITSQKVVSLAYPYGESNSTVQNIAQNIYIGARGVDCSLNIAPFNFYNLRACAPDEGDDIYSWADSAVSQRGWLVVYLHTLNDGIDGCYGSYDIDLLTTYLDYIRNPSRNLWIGPVGTALKYIRERAAATISVVSSASDLIVLNLTDTLNDAIYNQPLTLRSDVPSNWVRVRVQQGSTTTEVNSVVEGTARVVYYNAVPDLGYISLSNPQSPTITSLAPNSATVGGAAFNLTVSGSNFVTGATVRWNGSNRTTTFISATELRAAVTAANIAATGSFPVTVRNPDGSISNAVNFEVKAPAPVVADLTPSVTVVGGAAFNLTVSGSNFVTGATVRWNGSNRTTTFVSTTQLRAAVGAADIAAAGTFPVTVINPDGGVSNSMNFTVWGPLPVVNSLTPSSATVGGAAFNLTVSGSNFVTGATVRWNGSNRTTTFVSATQLQAAVAAADIAAVGTIPVTVLNPDGGVSGAMSFEVRAPLPAVIGLSPSFAIAGGAAFNLTVTGSNFVTGATVRWNGSSRTTTFVSATQLQAAVGAADIAAVGTIPVTVLNPDGGVSNTLSFEVRGPSPAVTGLSPSFATAGGAAFNLTVTGSNFVNGAMVRWNGSSRTTTFVSATQLQAAVGAADIAAVGTIPVTVSNPDGGVSNAVNFEVRVAPAVTGLSPSSATAGGAAFNLTVTGSNFVNGATVRWNGSSRTTTFVSATQLQAAVGAADIAAAGTIPVTVLNPDGGLSNALSFEVRAAPAVTGLSPSSATAGGAPFNLTVSGSNFVTGATVRWNGSSRTTTFVSATQLQAAVGAADIAAAGTIPVTVLNPDGGLSNAVNFEVRVAPAVAGLSPSFATAGGTAFTLTVTGSNFVTGATVRWNGSSRTTTFVSATQLQAAVTAADIAAVGTFPVTVVNPEGGLSNAVNFEVRIAPAVTGLNPSSATAGGVAFNLTVTGSNFVNGATVRWNGSNRTATFISATELQAAVGAADIAAAGTIPVTVLNPDGGVSSAVNFDVRAAPAVTGLSPSSATAGGVAFNLTVTGGNFVNGATVRWNGSNRSTTFISATELRAALGAADIAAAGTFPVTVVNPEGGLSNAVNFEVRVAPAVTGLNPSFAFAGGSAFNLTVSGSNFVNGATVRWNGSSRTTTFVSATQLQAAVGAADIAAAGTIPVTVLNPEGGLSNAVNFEVRAAPAVTGLNPSFATAGGVAFTLTVSGSNFVNGATVRWNGSSRTTTFVSATQLQAAVGAADIAAAGTTPVTVLNPDGGVSNAVNFEVRVPLPPHTVTGLSPSSATAGGTAFNLTVTGSNFVTGATVRWNGSNRVTTFVSETQLQAAVGAADIAAVGTIPVTVLNPDGGVSNAVNFEVRAAPAVTGLSPSVATAGGAAFPLTVTGSNFVNGATVRWNGSNRVTTFGSATQLQAAVTVADIAAAGTIPVTVINPEGGLSNAVNFEVRGLPPTGVTLSPSPSSPQPPGTSVTWTAAAGGGSGPYEYMFVIRNPAGAWTIARAYSSTPSWIWNTTGLATGAYYVQVWARSVGSANNYDVYNGMDYTLGAVVVPATGVTLSPSPSSPQPPGMSVTWTAAASGGSGPYEYMFVIRDPAGAWTIARAYSSTPSWIWDTTGLATGAYYVQVWARSVGSANNYDVYNGMDYTLGAVVVPATGVTLSPSPSSPQPPGMSVTWTAAASGGSGSYEYMFVIRNPAGAWTIARAYSSTPSWIWNTTGLATGAYYVQVWARSVGSANNYDVYNGMDYTLGAVVVPATGVTLSPSPSSPQPPGMSVTWTAAASGGSGPYEYMFVIRDPAGAWTIARAYSSTPSWIWDTTGLATGAYYVQVWARSVGSANDYDVYNGMDYTLGAVVVPATGVTLSPSPSSPQPPGMSVTWTAAASGGSGSYEYMFVIRDPAGAWTIARAYSSTPSWIWDTMELFTGAYYVQVWARSVGSANNYDVYNGMDYTIQ